MFHRDRVFHGRRRDWWCARRCRTWRRSRRGWRKRDIIIYRKWQHGNELLANYHQGWSVPARWLLPQTMLYLQKIIHVILKVRHVYLDPSGSVPRENASRYNTFVFILRIYRKSRYNTFFIGRIYWKYVYNTFLFISRIYRKYVYNTFLFIGGIYRKSRFNRFLFIGGIYRSPGTTRSSSSVESPGTTRSSSSVESPSTTRSSSSVESPGTTRSSSWLESTEIFGKNRFILKYYLWPRFPLHLFGEWNKNGFFS